MAKTNPETILLKGDPLHKEADAGAAITPGQLLRRASTGKVIPHDVANGRAGPLFAKENDIGGDGIEHAYAENERVLFLALSAGDEVYAILADGENAAIGSYLESNGAGELQVVAAGSGGAATGTEVGVALAAVNASDSAATPLASRRIKVEIL